MEQQNAFHDHLCQHGQFSQIWSHIYNIHMYVTFDKAVKYVATTSIEIVNIWESEIIHFLAKFDYVLNYIHIVTIYSYHTLY